MKENIGFLNLKLLIIFLLMPIYLNFIYNLFNENFRLPYLSIINFLVSFFCFILLFLIGKIISKIFKLKQKSVAIVLYLMSFYVFNFLSLIFIELSFNIIFFVVNIIWFLLAIKDATTNFLKTELFSVFILVGVLRVLVSSKFNFNLISNSRFNPSFSWDVDYFWYPMTEVIFNSSLQEAIYENIIPGYGLMTHYIHALLAKLFFGFEQFVFFETVSHTYLLLFCLFIYELDLKTPSKLLVVSLVISIFLNSDWLSYLFLSSLMGEGMTAVFFSIIFYYIINFRTNNLSPKNILILFIFSFIYFTKPFLSYIFFVGYLLLTYKSKRSIYLLLGLSGVLLNEIIYSLKFIDKTSNNYINKETFYGVLNNLNINSVKNIFINVIETDKIISYLILGYLILNIVLFANKYKFSIYEKINNLLLILNLFLIVILYSTVWQTIEVGSAYRYIVVTLPLLFINIGHIFNKYTMRKQFF